jgi:hypothetical protein
VKTLWFLAKYVPDLRRNEPRNIGIVLFCNGIASARFLAENADGSIDGRTLRSFRSSDNYRAWIHRWRHDLKAVRSEEDFAGLARPRIGSSYYLAPGGETGVEVRNPSALLDSLYAELVG